MTYTENNNKENLNSNQVDTFEKSLTPDIVEKASKNVDFQTKEGILSFFEQGYEKIDLQAKGSDIIKGIEKTLDGNMSKDEIRKYEILIEEVRLAGINFSAKPIKESINNQKKESIRKDMLATDFHNTVFDAYLQKTFSKESNDQQMFAYIKNSIPQSDITKAIDKFFNTGLNNPYDKGGFSSQNLQRIFDEQYGTVVTKDLIPNIEKYEISFKKQKVKEYIAKTIDSFLDKYTLEAGFKEEYKAELESKYGKNLDKSSDTDVKIAYKNTLNNKTTIFDKGIKNDVFEKVTDYNRDYLYGQMEQIPGVEKSFLKHFNIMLDDTESKTINRFAEALNYPGQNPKILDDIKNKIEERGVENSKRFTNAAITNTEIQPSNSKFKYETVIQPREKTKSINIPATQEYFNTITSNPNISQIVITIPKDNPLIFSQIQDIIPESIKYKTSLIEGSVNNVQFDIVENKEVPATISLNLNRLEANIIGNHNSIYATLAKDPEMKKIIDNPDYMITGGTIEGMASRNPTNYQSIFADNPEFAQWLNSYQKPQNSNDRNITNNPSLAFDRAASFLDFFTSKDGKVKPESKFDIQYKVDGPNRSELTNSLSTTLQRKPTETEILEAFKEWQNATINLNLLKKEEKIYSNTIDLDIEEKVASFSISISSEKSSTGGGGGSSNGWGEKTRAVSGNGLVNGGKIPKNIARCPW